MLSSRTTTACLRQRNRSATALLGWVLLCSCASQPPTANTTAELADPPAEQPVDATAETTHAPARSPNANSTGEPGDAPSQQPTEIEIEEPAEGSSISRAVDSTHRVLSDSIQAAVLRIDRFFSREEALRDSSESWVRIRPEVGYDTDDQVDLDLNVAARIDLPGLSDRLSLVVWTDGDRVSEDDRFTDTLDHDNGGGIALERDSGRPLTKWNVRPGIGIKGGWLPDPFLQIRATRWYNLEGTWVVRAEGTTRYLYDDEWDLRGELSFNRPIGEHLLFRLRTELRYRQAKDHSNANQHFTFFQKLSEKKGMTYEFAIFSSDDPDWGVRNYRFLVGYKQLIYKDWLYAEFIPELSFKDENDWDVTPGIRVRLEAFIGKRRSRPDEIPKKAEE